MRNYSINYKNLEINSNENAISKHGMQRFLRLFFKYYAGRGVGQYYSGVDNSSIKLWDGCMRVHYTVLFCMFAVFIREHYKRW